MLALTCWVEPGHCNMRFQVHQFSWSFNSCKAELLSPFHGEQAQGRGKTSRAGALGRHLDKGRLPELLPKAAQPPDPGLLNFLSWLLSTLSVHFLTHMIQEAQVQSLGWEALLENRIATHSSILAWRIPWTIHGVAKSWEIGRAHV